MNRCILYLVLLLAGCATAKYYSPDEERCTKDISGMEDERMAACTRAITSGQLPPFDLALTYYNRGLGWQSEGDYDRAIADYTETLQLVQFYHGYWKRGDAWRRKGDYDRAIEDYSLAIRLEPAEWGIYFDRGVTRFIQGQFDVAANDFAVVLRLKPNAYVVVWRYVAQSRAGHQAAAASELPTNAAKVDKARWPAPVIDLLAGKTDADGVLNAAAATSDQKTQRKQMCEAEFVVGEWHLLQDRLTEARASLERAKRDCLHTSDAYSTSLAELKRLSQ